MRSTSELIANRRKSVRKSWEAFKKSSPWQIAEIIRRSKAKLPREFIPWAPGIMIASDRLFLAAGYSSGLGSRRPTGWRRQKPGDIFGKGYRFHLPRLIVRKHGDFWMIEKNSKCLSKNKLNRLSRL